ncbi:helix-turn-helix domain-containing protein [Hoylesella buccalis]|uniref:Multidrug DMT transporter permease n=1 Tax=Hoylesella buccalis DNF00853 TaxID=1401074 RepID=A0A095ZJ20_9BACT|nr:helix-turn-helix domain-containing protein [Hoylesella buccalis]KGF34321.1 multidrug DMT transporter permease [Hoylesella buccalis DNF00853]
MGYFIITDSNWAKLRNEILSLAETCHKAFGERIRHTDWLHNGDVCRLLNISKRTLQHYRDTGVLPFAQIGHKCYYKREDVEWLLQTKSEKPKTVKSKNNT